VGNFEFLGAEWPSLATEAVRAERNGVADPRTCCFYARRCLELTVGWLYDADATLTPPYRDDLSARLWEPSLRTLVGADIHAKMDLIRRAGNRAVHQNAPVTPRDSIPVLGQLFQVLFWVARRYSRDSANLPAAGLAFNPEAIPRPVPASVRLQRQAELQAQEARLAEQDAAIARERERSSALEVELAQLRVQVAAAKVSNESRPDLHDYDEATTRDLVIDGLLKEAGWTLDRPEDREYEVTGMPTPQGRGFVDYVLWGDDGKPLGLVEAKRTRRDARVGQQQAKLYADCLQAQFGQRPVIFYTNGYETGLWDDAAYPPRPVQGFYTRSELAFLVQRRSTRRPLADVAIASRIVERHYQHRAIRRVGEAFEGHHQRQALVVMATGAGKTRTVIALVDLLMRSNWCKRVLFLADRVALVKQAVGAFKTHLPDATTVNLVTDKSADGRVYVSTYPTMMGLINSGAGDLRRFGPGFFDLVVIDEAHRSVYQKYGAIFDWFDSLLVGLTATPKDEVDRNTYRLFNLEDGVPTDSYSLDEAVREGYLVPAQAISVPLKFPRDGIRYDDLSEQEKDEWDARDWDEDGDVPDLIASDAVNKWLFNADTVDKMLATLMTAGHHVAGGDRLGKTIIFARNTHHAEFIRDRFDAIYPVYSGSFARVITHTVEYNQTLIDDFSIRDKPPHIAISVDMLDTGIDVPEVVNLVFLKPIRSKTKFWQMLGRGTRLCPDLYGPGQDKTDFRIFDFCENLEFFGTDPATVDGNLAESLSQRLFKARLEVLGGLDARLVGTQSPIPESPTVAAAAPGIYTVDAPLDGTRTEAGLRHDVASTLQEIVAGMNVDNFLVRPQRRWVEIYAELDRWDNLTGPEAGEVAEHLSGLPSAVKDPDEQAKRFDLLILRLQLCVLNAEPGFERLRDQVREIASALLEVTNIPAVGQQRELLDEVAGEEWWVDVTLPILELLRRRIRALVRLIEKTRRLIVYTDFVDSLGESTEVTLSGLPVGTDVQRFQAKVRSYLRVHLDHVALQKLRRNKPLSATDLEELERMLAESGLGPDDIARGREQAHGLGLFVRGMVGLDRESASEALSSFIDGRKLTGSQLDFLNLIVGYLTEHGVMDAGLLYESPFTEVAPLGPESLFTPDEIDLLIAALDQVHQTAAGVAAA
jgi:type I restriction enzyme R subunit